MKLISIIILNFFIYINCALDCTEIKPDYSSDCILSDKDLRNVENFKYCCYHEFVNNINTIKKCLPYTEAQYKKLYYDIYFSEEAYFQDRYLKRFICNSRSIPQVENEETEETGCNSIKPSNAADCKLSRKEYIEGGVDLCCYVQDSTKIAPYCRGYNKSDIDSEITEIRRYTSSISTFVCLSASFLKVSFFIIAILLL